MEQILIIFGSAAAGAVAPRDIDVAYTGEWTDASERAVRQWAERYALPTDLPIDAHRVTAWNGSVALPAVHPDAAEHVVIRGECDVRRHVYSDLPALVRRHGHDAPALRAALESGARLALNGDERVSDDWSGYTQGLTALRNAIRHAPAWSDAGPVATYLDELLTRADISDLMEPLRAGSPAGAPADQVICRVGSFGLFACHGGTRAPWVANLCPHSVIVRSEPSAAPEILPSDLVLPSVGALRLAQTVADTASRVAGVPVRDVVLTTPTEFPPALWRVVSMPLAQAMCERPGFVCPATGPADEPVRDARGQVFAVRRFARF